MSRSKAVALCRVSTSKQRVEGSSLEAQEKRVLDAAALLGVDLPDEYIWRVDISSRKGKNLKRRDLNEIREVCRRNKKIKYLIVDEPDRFMRSIKEYYWWKVEFEQLGVLLRFAADPLANDDDQRHVFDELIDVYRAESSNQERSTKTRDKMQAKIDAGYYPGHHHLGYKTSEIRGLHVPDHPRFDYLQTALQAIAAGTWTIAEAWKYLEIIGLRLPGGRKLDMEHFRRLLKEPYYCGVIKMGSFRENPKGLHEAMITKDEFTVIIRLVQGHKPKFKVKKHNPGFPMNSLIHEPCFIAQGIKHGRFIGYTHHNGKPGARRKYYQRYHCRNCHKAFLRDELHGQISAFIQPVRLKNTLRSELIQHLRKAWAETEEEQLSEVVRLQARLKLAQEQKFSLTLSLAENPELKEDIKEAIEGKKAEISDIQSDLAEAQDIEHDFCEFAVFALDFVDNLRDRWWDLDHEDRGRCEQLLFPERLRINKSGKVSTPKISPIYRYKADKKAPPDASNSSDGTPYVKKLAPIIGEFQRWRPMLENKLQEYKRTHSF